MFIGRIAGFVFLPVSIILFLNIFGIITMTSLFGLDVRLIAALGLIVIQAGDIVDSHLKGEYIILYWIIGLVLCLPGIIFFLSKAVTLPEVILNALPLIIACFLFTEGMESFFIGSG